MEEQIKIGDVVRLNSGGPLMSVEEISDTGNAKCAWATLDHNGVARTNFPVVCLIKELDHTEGQPSVDNAHVSPGCEQFSAATIAANTPPSRLAAHSAIDVRNMLDRMVAERLVAVTENAFGKVNVYTIDEVRAELASRSGTDLAISREGNTFNFPLPGGGKIAMDLTSEQAAILDNGTVKQNFDAFNDIKFTKVDAAPAAGRTMTFDEFVQFGRDQGVPLVGNMPWSFEFMGQPVTHENDKCYLIGSGPGQFRLTSDDVMDIAPGGEKHLRNDSKPVTAIGDSLTSSQA